ncbi:MAG: c-type cytochrome [Caldilineaceae bacterium]
MRILALFLLLCVLLAGCGAAESPTSTPLPTATPPPLQPGDAERGVRLFQEPLLGSRPEPGCITCHSLQPGVTLVGPSLQGVAARAATVIADPNYQGTAESAAEYLHESINAPDLYVAPGFVPGLMRPTFAEALTAQEQADLVAYLLTLQ